MAMRPITEITTKGRIMPSNVAGSMIQGMGPIEGGEFVMLDPSACQTPASASACERGYQPFLKQLGGPLLFRAKRTRGHELIPHPLHRHPSVLIDEQR